MADAEIVPIICANNAKTIVLKIQEHLKNNGTIKGMYVVDFNDNQVVILVSSEEEIEEKLARIWWNGYKNGLGQL